jgi:hypothetical protein
MDTLSIILGISYICAAFLCIVVSIPLVRRKVAMNRTYGVRIKKAFESDENWYKINAYGGRQLILWSILLAVVGCVTVFLPLSGNLTLIIVVSCAPLIVIIPVIMCCRYARTL